MLSVCLYLHVHQPRRIKKYRVFDIGEDHQYFNDDSETDLNNKRILMKVAQKSYLPTNLILLDLLDRHPEFKLSLSISGVVLDQMEEFFPEILETFKELVATGRVEILADTYYHSLAFFYSKKEFERQVLMYKKKVNQLFGVRPKILRNTELSYSNDLAAWAEEHGYIGIMAEGWDRILGWRSPNFLYKPKNCRKIKVLLKNYRLSDDIAFRFSEHSWEGWPLTADKFARWVHSYHGNGQTVNLFMDYETFGEHQWEEGGIFDFLKALPGALLSHPDTIFKTPTETVISYSSVGELDVPDVLTWADTERDLSAWTGNQIQQAALKEIYALESAVLHTKDLQLIEDWRRLQTSDHFYYMCTKWFADGDVHKYFNPYETPYDAYIAYMNTLSDLRYRIEENQQNNLSRSLLKKLITFGKKDAKKEKNSPPLEFLEYVS